MTEAGFSYVGGEACLGVGNGTTKGLESRGVAAVRATHACECPSSATSLAHKCLLGRFLCEGECCCAFVVLLLRSLDRSSVVNRSIVVNRP